MARPSFGGPGESEIQTCAPESCIGRWMSTKLPSMRRGQERRVLVVGLHHEPASLEVSKVLGERERDAGAPFAEGGVRDRILAELLDERDPRVLDPPELLGVRSGSGRSVGSASTTQPSTPLAERAAHKWE